MLITLIVPFYNEEKHLSRSIRSIQQQTFTDYEVLLIDDLSTDGSYALAEQLAQGDKRFRLIRNGKKGLYHARNNALAAAQGEYICFLDADDELLPDYLFSLYTDNKHPGADLVIQGFSRIQGDRHESMIISRPGSFDLEKDPQSFFASCDVSCMSNVFGKLYRRSLIQKHQLSFSPQVLMCEDMYFVLSYLSVCRRVILSDKSNYRYILHSQSMSTCYWSFETERSSFSALQDVWQRLLDRYDSSALRSSYGAFVGSYINRLVFSALTHPDSQGKTRTFMDIINADFLPVYRRHYSPFTLFTKSLKVSVLSHQYWFYRFLMQLAKLRYRMIIHYR